MSKTDTNWLDDIDSQIRSGAAPRARLALRERFRKKLARAELARFANLARRAELPLLALRVLNPVVRPPGSRVSDASELERAEYAASLSQVGAPEEAAEILAALDPTQLPQALLFHAYTLMAQWRYAESIGVLRRYVAHRDVDEYFRRVGQVNLAAALLFERAHGEAGPLLDELISETRTGGMQLLHGNVLELAAQDALFQGKWDAAERHLAHAERAIRNTGMRDELFVLKWRCVLKLVTTGRDAAFRASARWVRAEAMRLSHWETLRTLDRFEAVHARDRGLFLHLYFGTPFESFRARLVREFGEPEDGLPEGYLWRLKGEPSLAALDVAGGISLVGKPRTLKRWQALHRLALALSRDFYRPHRLASLHHQLYPGEHFDPLTSPQRVRQVILRLRDWLRRSRLPLEVAATRGGYHWRAAGRCALWVARPCTQRSGRPEWQRLREAFGKRPFSVREAAASLGLPERTTSRLLKEEERLRIVREGKGKRARYRLTG